MVPKNSNEQIDDDNNSNSNSKMTNNTMIGSISSNSEQQKDEEEAGIEEREETMLETLATLSSLSLSCNSRSRHSSHRSIGSVVDFVEHLWMQLNQDKPTDAHGQNRYWKKEQVSRTNADDKVNEIENENGDTKQYRTEWEAGMVTMLSVTEKLPPWNAFQCVQQHIWMNHHHCHDDDEEKGENDPSRDHSSSNKNDEKTLLLCIALACRSMSQTAVRYLAANGSSCHYGSPLPPSSRRACSMAMECIALYQRFILQPLLLLVQKITTPGNQQEQEQEVQCVIWLYGTVLQPSILQLLRVLKNKENMAAAITPSSARTSTSTALPTPTATGKSAKTAGIIDTAILGLVSTLLNLVDRRLVCWKINTGEASQKHQQMFVLLQSLVDLTTWIRLDTMLLHPVRRYMYRRNCQRYHKSESDDCNSNIANHRERRENNSMEFLTVVGNRHGAHAGMETIWNTRGQSGLVSWWITMSTATSKDTAATVQGSCFPSVYSKHYLWNILFPHVATLLESEEQHQQQEEEQLDYDEEDAVVSSSMKGSENASKNDEVQETSGSMGMELLAYLLRDQNNQRRLHGKACVVAGNEDSFTVHNPGSSGSKNMRKKEWWKNPCCPVGTVQLLLHRLVREQQQQQQRQQQDKVSSHGRAIQVSALLHASQRLLSQYSAQYQVQCIRILVTTQSPHYLALVPTILDALLRPLIKQQGQRSAGENRNEAVLATIWNDILSPILHEMEFYIVEGGKPRSCGKKAQKRLLLAYYQHNVQKQKSNLLHINAENNENENEEPLSLMERLEIYVSVVSLVRLLRPPPGTTENVQVDKSTDSDDFEVFSSSTSTSFSKALTILGNFYDALRDQLMLWESTASQFHDKCFDEPPDDFYRLHLLQHALQDCLLYYEKICDSV